MTDASRYQPTHPHCRKVWERLDEQGRQERFAEARRRERFLKVVESQVDRGESERQVVKGLAGVDGVDRSNYRRWKQKYEAHRLDGLIDWRMPRR